MMSWFAAVCLMMLSARSYAGVAPERLHEALQGMQNAAQIARASQGDLLAVGDLFADPATPGDTVVVLRPALISEIRQGAVLLLLKEKCQPTRICFAARRVISLHSGVLTEPYPSTDNRPFYAADMQVVGVVLYAINLENLSVKDLRAGQVEKTTLEAALAHESAQSHLRWPCCRVAP